MKKLILFCFTILTIQFANAQVMQEAYVCYSTGLNMRKSPFLKAELIGKIPYSTKLKYDMSKKDTSFLNVEGLYGYWVPVTYQNKNGWVLDCYLTSLVPPKKGTKKMSDYLAQIATKSGTAVSIKKGTMHTITESGNKQTKQLYNNGAQHNTYLGYEYGSDTYFLPNTTMQEAFLILRQIDEFADIFNEKTDYPNATKKQTKKIDKQDVEFEYKIQKENYGFYDWIKKIEIEYSEGATYMFNMFQLENDTVVFLGSGV